MSPAKSTVESSKGKELTLADQQHPLGNLQGKCVDSCELVVLLGPKNRFGASYFQVFLQNQSGEVSQ